uniref:Uncharacterized protein n=1 Tax=Vespula pensylvanica TaxID=30213 RepID=A0A834P4Z7_VESPE|nr:hypothetical protein H0235_005491 [Vespula pensylvanica]
MWLLSTDTRTNGAHGKIAIRFRFAMLRQRDWPRQQLEQSVYCESESRRSAVEDERQDVHGTNQDKIKGTTTQDLFELLERVQSSRLDDQRCVLPPYFSQLSRCECKTTAGDEIVYRA